MLFSRDKNGDYEKYKVSDVDPNPKKFVLEIVVEIFNHTLIFLNYPNCTNYEGNKIILFRNTSKREVLKIKEIDPHFTEENKLKPFARFEPTKEGWEAGLKLAKIL